MAELTFDKFWWGMSTTSLFANSGEAAYLEWVETTQDISLVKNLNPWRLDLLTDWNEMLVHFNATGTITSRQWYAWEGGQIYTQWSTDNIPEIQLANTRLITDSASLQGGIFLCQSDWNKAVIHRLNEDNASLWGTASFQEELFISDSSGWFYSDENLYINSFWEWSLILIKGSQIYKLLVWVDWNNDEKATLTLDRSFNLWKTVVWVSTTTDFIKFFTKDWRILMYNKNFTLVSETVTNLLLHDITTVNNTDYIISEDALYYLEWNTPREILIDWNKWLYIINNDRKLYTWRANLYVPIEIDNKKKIMAIGVDNEWFPRAKTLLPTIDEDWNEVFISYWVGWRFDLSAWLNVATTWKWIYSLNWSKTLASWIIYTDRFNAWNSVETKWINEIIVSGSYSNWSTIQTIINNDIISDEIDLSNWGDEDQVVRISELNRNFLNISIRINLKWNDKFYWVKLRYATNKQ